MLHKRLWNHTNNLVKAKNPNPLVIFTTSHHSFEGEDESCPISSEMFNAVTASRSQLKTSRNQLRLCALCLPFLSQNLYLWFAHSGLAGVVPRSGACIMVRKNTAPKFCSVMKSATQRPWQYICAHQTLQLEQARSKLLHARLFLLLSH